ncbi:hypothetical protein FA15DRAFT_748420 [Coprinopsis marcescibilis]|uniref:Immunoreactive mannoprotein MP88 n=1 Tax=Coprinopsis marcescibilis TaxID=230819 RepID=A0A5C3L2X1_COPMA|nr:hypothetical protein FA15DRAFT_748420 [Coprinopsis marcescibilis]
MHKRPQFRFGLVISLIALILYPEVQAADPPPGVIATGTQGPTNPPQPTLGTPVNQTSDSRLLTVNSIEDFCVFAPPSLQDIGNSETYEVAWCTQPRNNARVIPDGTLTGVSFLKTGNHMSDFYVQIMGYGNFTRLNIPDGDYGGELDPHGQFGDGNPIGGNVTSNTTGSDQNYAEWMVTIDHLTLQFCLRVCTNANSTYSAADMCWHELDEMGCEFVMPGNYHNNGTFESCDAEIAYPPGWYPTATQSGSPVFSTFAQRYTGTLSDGSTYTVGGNSTPAAPYFTPSSSNCVTTKSVSNGIPLTSLGLVASTSSSTTRTSGTTSASSTGSARPGSRASGTSRETVLEGKLWVLSLVLIGMMFN